MSVIKQEMEVLTEQSLNQRLTTSKENTSEKRSLSISPKIEGLMEGYADDDSENIESDSAKPVAKRRKVYKANKKREIQTVQQVKCSICRQFLEHVPLYHGHPKDAAEEFIVLTYKELNCFDGSDDYALDERPHLKITHFSVYDKGSHLCPIDSGLLEANAMLYFSGYLKPIHDEDPTIEGGFPAYDLGPLNEWWIAGYDGGEKAIIGFSTPYAEYMLMDPSREYAPLMKNVTEKIYMSKLTIEFLRDNEEAEYEDLIEKLQVSVPPPGLSAFTEECLLKHAQFICNQVQNFDSSAAECEQLLMNSPCMHALVKLAGISYFQRKKIAKKGLKDDEEWVECGMELVEARGSEIKRKSDGKKRSRPQQQQARVAKYSSKSEFTKATTTHLVRNVFETFFAEQMAGQNSTEKTNISAPRKKRCGVCKACLEPDCGSCYACRSMVKFGGTGTNKRACIKRNCPNMALDAGDESVEEEENDDDEKLLDKLLAAVADSSNHIRRHRIAHHPTDEEKSCRFSGDATREKNKVFYQSAFVCDVEYTIGDYILVEASDPSLPPYVGRAQYFYEKESQRKSEKFVHVHWLMRGRETILGETADAKEVFVSEECEDAELSGVVGKASVTYKPVPKDWNTLGNSLVSLDTPVSHLEHTYNPNAFFYQHKYDEVCARFEFVAPMEEFDAEQGIIGFCDNCATLEKRKKIEMPTLVDGAVAASSGNSDSDDGDSEDDGEIERKFVKGGLKFTYGAVRMRGEEYRIGNCVFLNPDAVKFKKTFASVRAMDIHVNDKTKKINVDEDVYPELYRKNSDSVAGSNKMTPDPFAVGRILAIGSRKKFFQKEGNVSPDEIYLVIGKFYRPHNTCKSQNFISQADLNLLFWSDEECLVKFASVAGKCYVSYDGNIEQQQETPAQWSKKGPHRFYFSEAYDGKKETFYEPSSEAQRVGDVLIKMAAGKGCKNKSKSSAALAGMRGKAAANVGEEMPEWPSSKEPLRMLDVFAGCGGLSEGLHQSGVAKTLWAIEKEEAAAHAFRLNNPDASVFTDDCNELLSLVMDENIKYKNGQKLPQKGDVEMLCGGPPCQGFSGMNRFNQRQYSLFKNSLIVSYLSYCDYYRPSFFVLENVRNFVSFKQGMVLKLTLRCLQKMGYQCTFGVLQAGNYGVPQTRRRAIILAAAPDQVLPYLPEPTHVFNLRSSPLAVTIDDKRYASNLRWINSAPYKTTTVRDAMSDLPSILNGASECVLPYDSIPMSHYQRMIRGGVGDDGKKAMVNDHICKEMTCLVEARIALIPTTPGADWRDLPNKVVELRDGTRTKKLQYIHHDKKNGKSSTGALRGVCVCATGDGKRCDPSDKQENTLIPWCLPHTANRNNQWAGLYGRVQWDGFFSTTITNPEPMGKQGRVLHPEQTRVVSVRECARSQGFPDSYRFFGTVQDKHRQVGNAVPPPMGAALGIEIKKCVVKRVEQVKDDDAKDLNIL